MRRLIAKIRNWYYVLCLRDELRTLTIVARTDDRPSRGSGRDHWH